MKALVSKLVEAVKREPVILLAFVGIAANAVYDVVAGDVAAATAVESVVVAVGALLARSRVTPTG